MIKKMKYNLEFRVKALELADKIGMQQAARQLNIHLNSLLLWKKKVSEQGLLALENTSRKTQFHPGKKLSDKIKIEILEIKKQHPDYTYKRIKEELKLDCDISVLSRLLHSPKKEIAYQENILFLGYRVLQSNKKNNYSFYLQTPAYTFFAMHDELDFDFIVNCCHYWLGYLSSNNLIDHTFQLDISSLYLILKDKKKALLSQILSDKYKICLSTASHHTCRMIESLWSNYNLGITAHQYLFNFINYRSFYLTVAPASGIVPSAEEFSAIYNKTVYELEEYGEYLFRNENLQQALNVFELIIKCTELKPDIFMKCYRNAMLRKAKILSCNTSFLTSESIYRRLIDEDSADHYAAYCFLELSDIYSYLGKTIESLEALEKADSYFSASLKENGENPEYSCSLCRIYIQRKNYDLAIDQAEVILKLPDSKATLTYKCDAMFLKGTAFYNQHNFSKAAMIYEELLGKHNWPLSFKQQAMIYFNLAQLAYANTDLTESEKRLTIAISRAEKTGYQLLLARCMEIYAYINQRKNNFDEAVSRYLYCLELYTNFGIGKDVCRVCYQLGVIYMSLNKSGLQLKWSRELLKYAVSTNNNTFIIYAYDMICVYYYHQKNFSMMYKNADLMIKYTNTTDIEFFKTAASVYIAVAANNINRKNAGLLLSNASHILDSIQRDKFSNLYQDLVDMLNSK